MTRAGIEPGSAKWEARMLPLDHSGGLYLYNASYVGVTSSHARKKYRVHLRVNRSNVCRRSLRGGYSPRHEGTLRWSSRMREMERSRLQHLKCRLHLHGSGGIWNLRKNGQIIKYLFRQPKMQCVWLILSRKFSSSPAGQKLRVWRQASWAGGRVFAEVNWLKLRYTLHIMIWYSPCSQKMLYVLSIFIGRDTDRHVDMLTNKE